jgi:hypothetical protein
VKKKKKKKIKIFMHENVLLKKWEMWVLPACFVFSHSRRFARLSTHAKV